MAKKEYLRELEIIRNKNDGILRPHDVVHFAANPKTALHSHFTWDDTKAAQEYRLEEARRLIRVAVVLEPNTSKTVRAYVSLTGERNQDGGYRAIAEVLSDEDLMARLLDDALDDLNLFKNKYETLRQLSKLESVFQAIDTVLPPKKKLKKKVGK